MNRLGNLVVISGPSGVGKSTLVKRVRERLTDLQFSVSCTTREPRPGERDGVDYHFLPEAEFLRRLERGEFLEHAQVFRHHYGTLRSEAVDRIQQGGTVILDIDVQGAAQIRQAAEQDEFIRRTAAFILIAPPDLATLRRRLTDRHTESSEQLELRLTAAARELKQFRIYDYLVINDELDRAAEELYMLLCCVGLRSANIIGEPF